MLTRNEVTWIVPKLTSSSGHRHPPFWIYGRTNGTETVSEDRIICIKDWLHTCEGSRSHRECQPSNGYLPKRLIDVRSGKPLRLVATKNLVQDPDSGRYATLSHCWGTWLDTSPLRTTRETEMEFSAIICDHLLPKTFRDAIKITRSLEIPYLWIDSMCIVQDNLDEWQTEASHMKDVYAGSVLTIAASDGKDSQWGCFPEDNSTKNATERKMEPILNLGIRNSGSDQYDGRSNSTDSTTRVFSFKHQDERCDHPQDFMVRFQASRPQNIRRRAHLSTRGWVLQEQILSHRTVHCLDAEVHWQCRCSYKTQAGQDLLEDGSEYGLNLIDERTRHRSDQLWPKWAQDYSNREFTNATDRLPAFAGIASYYESLVLQETYLGIRKSSLTIDLSWIRIGPNRAHGGGDWPSWTWLCSDARVLMEYRGIVGQEDGYDILDHTTMVSHNICWSGPPMTSLLESGLLILNGPVKGLGLRVAPEAKDYNPAYLLVNNNGKDLSNRPTPWNCAGQFDDEKRHTDVEVTYTCLLLRSTKSKTAEFYKETFLILIPATKISEDRNGRCLGFRRVGIASIEGERRTFADAENQRVVLF